MRTPRSVVWLWVVALALYASFPFAELSYWTALSGSGELPTDGDSIGIPIIGTFIVTIMLAPAYLGIAMLALRRYAGNSPVWVRPSDIEGWLWTILSLVLAGRAITELSLLFRGHVWGTWAEVHTAVSLVAAPFFRAAAVDRAAKSPSSSRA